MSGKSGNCIIKLNDIYNNSTIKLISIITSLFSDSYIIKPFASNLLKTDKYLICKNYKLDNINDDKTIIQMFNNLTKKINSNSKLYLNDIFLNYKVNNIFLNTIITFNNLFNNLNLVQINKTIKYVDSKNYFGEDYYNYNNKQIDNSEKWITKYYPINKLNINLEIIESEYKNLILTSNKNIEFLEKNLF